jgi:hypothetical protein
MAWTASNNMLTRNGSVILEHSLTQNVVHQGTNIHGVIASHTISGLDPGGYGMVKGLDGYIYATTSAGLQRFDPTTWGSATTLAPYLGGQGYGITALADGRIAYSAGAGNNEIYVYNPVGGSNTHIYSAPNLVDDMEGSASGHIALAGQGGSNMFIINYSGGLVNNFNTAHYPDGLAFGDGVTTNALFANNNDGTITKYVFSLPGFGGTVTATDIATGSGAYGDLAAVGPDCAFYVTQYENGGLNGSTAGIGTHWDNAVTNSEPSIIRIAAIDRLSGEEICGFGYLPELVPEPGSFMLCAAGVFIPLMRRRSR